MALNQEQTEILKLLTGTWEKYPDLRFCQLLWKLGVMGFDDHLSGKITDNFYRTDSHTLELMSGVE